MPEDFDYEIPPFIKIGSAMYQRARRLCIRYGCSYKEARVKHANAELEKYPLTE
jgi:hypothetical protein